MLNLTAAAVAPNQPTSMSFTTTLEGHLLRFSPVVVVLQNFHHHISADPKINLPLSHPLAAPTPSTPLTGEHDLVPLLVNPSPETSDLVKCRSGVRFSTGFI
jgi:hypothetical protein